VVEINEVGMGVHFGLCKGSDLPWALIGPESVSSGVVRPPFPGIL
jgi:hypothetical protein